MKDKSRMDCIERCLARRRKDEDVAFLTIAEENKEPKEVFALAASEDPDTMFYRKAMRGPDGEQLKGARKKEAEAKPGMKFGN